MLPGGPMDHKVGPGLEGYRSIHTDHNFWGGQQLHNLHSARGVFEVPVEDFEAVKDVTQRGIPLVQQTEICDAATGLRAVIECPVKTMNLAVDASAVPADGDAESQAPSIWQVDTGVIAYPDISKRYDRLVESVMLGFIATNNRAGQTHAADR